jgi:hypothetical protein
MNFGFFVSEIFYLCLRSCFKIPQLAQYGVKNRLKMLIYSM